MIGGHPVFGTVLFFLDSKYLWLKDEKGCFITMIRFFHFIIFAIKSQEL